MKLLLGFGNKARHGKDSAATAILDHIEKNNRRIQMHYASSTAITRAESFKFAAALYEECRQLHGMIEKDPVLLQRVGAARRAEDVNYWVDRAFKKVGEFLAREGNRVAIITDVRHKNEADAIRREGGYLINLTRLNLNGTVFVSPDRPANHISEVDLDGYNWDFYIRTHTGEDALAADQAITIYHYIRGLREGR